MIKFDEIYCGHFVDKKYLMKFDVYIEDDQVIFIKDIHKYNISELILFISNDSIQGAKDIIHRYERGRKINLILNEK